MDLRGRGALVTDGANATVRAVEKLGRKAVRLQIDQTDPTAIEPPVERATRDLGRLDVPLPRRPCARKPADASSTSRRSPA